MPTILPNVPLRPQSDPADCLPVCVEMVLAYYGRQVDPVWLRHVLESTDIGTPGFKVLNLQRHGYDVLYAAATNERALTTLLEQNIPPIALLFTANLPYWQRSTAHAVVVTGLTDDLAFLNDPAFAQTPQQISRDAFMLAWSDFDYLYAVIRPLT